jgi:hypothetical protein
MTQNDALRRHLQVRGLRYESDFAINPLREAIRLVVEGKGGQMVKSPSGALHGEARAILERFNLQKFAGAAIEWRISKAIYGPKFWTSFWDSPATIFPLPEDC